MNRVLVNSKHWQNAPYMLISNIDDLIEYKEVVGEALSNSITNVLRSNVAPEKWDHLLWGKNLGDSSLLAGLLDCNINGGNPLFRSGEIVDQKMINMLTHLNKGEQVLANYNGGYCFYNEESMSMKPDDTYVEPVNYKLADECSYINLENDPELEEHTKQWFYNRNMRVSYVVNLRRMIGADLIKIFKRFQMKGGHTVYVYTTGLDIPEMYEYSDNIIASGIKNVIFEFNAGITDEHKDVINYLEEAGITVESNK